MGKPSSLVSRRRTRCALSGSINRIPVSGGTPKLIAKAVGGPGLSPDGKFLVFHDTGFTRSYVIADSAGRRLSTFAPPPDMQVDWWTGKSTLVASKFTAPWRVGAHSLVDGTSRVVVDNLERIGSPAWSNDGKQIAFSVVEGSRAAIAVMDPSGSSPRTVPVDVAFPDGISWSPDNRWMLFHSARAPAAIAALEVATGRQVVLSANNTVAYATWADDSRHAFIKSIVPSDLSRPAIQLLEADLTGGTRVLRESPTGCGPRLPTVASRSQCSLYAGARPADHADNTLAVSQSRYFQRRRASLPFR